MRLLLSILVVMFTLSTPVLAEYSKWTMKLTQSWSYQPMDHPLIVGIASKDDMTIIIAARMTEMQTAHEMTEDFAKSVMKAVVPTMRVTAYRKTELAHLPAVVMEYEYEEGEKKMRAIEYTVVYQGAQYIVSGRYPARIFGGKKEYIEKIISTFRFVNKQ